MSGSSLTQRLYTAVVRPAAKLQARVVLALHDRGRIDAHGVGRGSVIRRRWSRRTGRSSGGARFLVLTTTGRRSGRSRRTPLSWLPGEDGSILVCASYGGSDRYPDWWLNLIAHGAAEVDVAGEVFPVTAEVLDDAARAQAWPRFAEIGYSAYQDRTARTLPIARLHRRAREQGRNRECRQ